MVAKNTVVVAMSGGVDSSVAAALLKQQGYDVIGMMMRLWSEPGAESSNRCCTPDAMAQARRVAAQLAIPFYAVDAQDEFYEKVVSYFINGYTQGVTPNPCLVCNRHIRWEFLLKRALAIGADFMATGHYARLGKDPQGRLQLVGAIDQQKDQSYVLHVLDQKQLSHALFPLGSYTKSQVRELARAFNLPVAERAESQDLCFLGDGDYRRFLNRQAPHLNQAGPILSRNGEVLGQHQGLAFYTIGQRKGLGIAAGQPFYVLEKDIRHNAIIVGGQDELGETGLIAGPMNWVSGEPPATDMEMQVKIRYKAPKESASIVHLPENRIRAQFDRPIRDITPGQAAVLYDGEVCLGGGIIQASLARLTEAL